MGFKFSERSKQRMEGVHPDIIAVMELAISRSPVDFTVLEGVRSLERQKELFAKRASKTMNSRHLTGHALDVAPLVGGEVTWSWPVYYELEPIIKGAARDLGVDLEWGGDWNWKDGPHWQLSWDTYGKDDMRPRANLSREMGGRSERDAPMPELIAATRAEPRPAPAKTVQAPVPKEVMDLIENSDGEGSKTDLLNKAVEWLTGGGIVAALPYVNQIDWRVAAAGIIGAAIVFSVAFYTRRSRKKKSDLALKARYALGQVV